VLTRTQRLGSVQISNSAYCNHATRCPFRLVAIAAATSPTGAPSHAMGESRGRVAAPLRHPKARYRAFGPSETRSGVALSAAWRSHRPRPRGYDDQAERGPGTATLQIDRCAMHSGCRRQARVLVVLPSRGGVESIVVGLALKLGSDLKHQLIDSVVERFAGAVTCSANQAQCSVDVFRSVGE
jgi:hypothetical protein